MSTFKERIDSFFSYQKKLHEIINKSANKPDTQIKAISELVRIEMAVYNTHKDLANTSFNFEDQFDFDSDLEKNDDYGPSLLSQADTSTLGTPKDNDNDSYRKKLRAAVESGALDHIHGLDLNPDFKPTDKELVCYCEDSILNHYECSKCGHVWCPEDKTQTQKQCPKYSRNSVGLPS